MWKSKCSVDYRSLVLDGLIFRMIKVIIILAFDEFGSSLVCNNG